MEVSPDRYKHVTSIRTVCITMFVMLMIMGCAGVRQSRPITEQYVLEYETPPYEETVACRDTVTVERFSIAPTYSGTDMVYRAAPFVRGMYHYHRWRVNPADMVTDFLDRDMQQSGLFAGVFSYHDYEKTRYRLGGHIREFFKENRQGKDAAVLEMTISLMDSSQRDTSRMILFQKVYHVEVLLAEDSPSAYAAGMSNALKTVSRSLLNDLRDTTGAAQGE
jgi:ABC-type uncharacterized transport system auxiliary subunit